MDLGWIFKKNSTAITRATKSNIKKKWWYCQLSLMLIFVTANIKSGDTSGGGSGCTFFQRSSSEGYIILFPISSNMKRESNVIWDKYFCFFIKKLYITIT